MKSLANLLSSIGDSQKDKRNVRENKLCLMTVICMALAFLLATR